MNKLMIENEKDFRIVKYIKKNNILRFKYSNEKYQLRVESVPNTLTTLYYTLDKYNPSINGYTNLCVGEFTTYYLSDLLIDVSKHNKSDNITYTNIDKVYLIKMLTFMGLVGGKYDKARQITLEQQADIDGRIKKLEEQISNLETAKEAVFKKYFSTTGHGSKLSPHVIKAEMSDRNIGKGYKKGDYIEQYDACIGDKGYGGVLTDLRELPCGTCFLCCNGNWYGSIGYNNKGNKTVDILETKNSVELSDSYCCLYIELLD